MLITITIEIFHMSSWDAWNDFVVSNQAAYTRNPLWKYINIFNTIEPIVPLLDQGNMPDQVQAFIK